MLLWDIQENFRGKSFVKIFQKLTISFSLILMVSSLAAQEKPNILYILVDNWGWGDIRIQGGSIPTPRCLENRIQVMSKVVFPLTRVLINGLA